MTIQFLCNVCGEHLDYDYATIVLGCDLKEDYCIHDTCVEKSLEEDEDGEK